MQAELSPETIMGVVREFNQCLNRQDLAGMRARLSEDTVFENTFPAPDGARYEGVHAVTAFWLEFIQSAPAARFDIEEIFAAGDRCVARWKYTWDDQAGKQGYIRGVDLFRVQDGKISEKLSYVKG